MKEHIDKLIASTEKKKKKQKTKYVKPDSVKQLEKDDYDFRYRDSSLPEEVKSYNKFRDDTANGLTKCITTFVKMHGGFASRINNMGTYRPDKGIFVRSNQRKGIADILGTIYGKSLAIEVKIGRDKMSDDQIEVNNEIKNAGGYYFIAKDFTSFVNWFDTFVKNK